MRFLVALSFVLFLTACGFQPMYGKNKYTAIGVEEKLALVQIENIPDREGQYLRNELIDRFYRSGRPDNSRFSLQVRPVKENLIELDITTESDSTRGQLKMSSGFMLRDLKTNEVVLTRTIQAITSYNILSSEFSTRVSEDNARLNALQDLSRQIEQQLNLYFKRTQ
ncbi:MAG: hypothetical protein KDJ35_05160 [Alphaproteobacteria bacterium]|nr:hypothetical protein [Alphaproteobacteria bacterium]